MPRARWTRYLILMALALGLLFLLMILAASLGASALTFRQSLALFWEKLSAVRVDLIRDLDPAYETIVFRVRWPRIILSVLGGASLAVVGASYQSIFMNALADPHILGVSSGAAFGASLAMIFGFKSVGLGLTGIGFGAFLGGLMTIGLLFLMTPGEIKTETSRILLAGIALSSLFSALMSLLMLFNRDRIAGIFYWLMGSYSSATWDKGRFMSLVFFPLTLLLFFFAPEMNIMLSGDEEATSLGVAANRMRWTIILIATLLVASTVSTSGVVGFVGLIVPHALRLLKIHDVKQLLPAAAVCGAIFTLLCDSFARLAIPPTELPVGVITAFFGVPLFLSLLYRSGKGAQG